MRFADTLLGWLSGALSFIGDGFNKILDLLAYPLGWIVALIEGIWYFISALFRIAIGIIDIFIALFQFLGALFMGFFRTIQGLLSINFTSTPVSYPSASQQGISVVLEKILAPAGFLTVVPMICLSVVWLLFILAVFKLMGGERD